MRQYPTTATRIRLLTLLLALTLMVGPGLTSDGDHIPCLVELAGNRIDLCRYLDPSMKTDLTYTDSSAGLPHSPEQV